MALYFTMILYTLSMSASPGPVNIVALSCGLSVGVRKSLAFVSGATLGFILLLFTVAKGLASLFSIMPALPFFITILASLLLIALSLSMIKTRDIGLIFCQGKGSSFYLGVAMQWLNPKAWLASGVAVTSFQLTLDSSLLYIFLIIYFVVCFFSILAWSYLGSRFAKYLTEHRVVLLTKFLGFALFIIAFYLLYSAVTGY
ncbi:LysE family translocator [Thalassotalea sediminis]|uniref:LysE family translocator n=1 Tax=Thalassotalea sediminis TaxID=1759089 RepID=UPI002572A110|nr:LysE family transporter [Thalassotalea sediminis]